MRYSPFSELELLCNGLAEGELDASEIERLEELVLTSDEAMEFYIKFFNVHHALGDSLFEGDCEPHFESILGKGFNSCLDDVTGESPCCNEELFPSLCDIPDHLIKPLLNSSTATDSSGGFMSGFFGKNSPANYIPLVVSLVSMFLVILALVIVPFYSARNNEGNDWALVARVTRSIDCRWVTGEKWSRDGAFLTAGQLLELESGLVEIEFSSGASVVLQGPARFITSAPKNSRLDYGKLTAIVPEEAEGFVVRTPGMDVVDLGTEFGVAVETNQKTDVHVFKGVVEMEAATKSGQKKTVRLKKNEAAEYDTASGNVAYIPVNSKKFVRDLDNLGVGGTVRLRIVPKSGTVSSESVFGLSNEKCHFGSVIYKSENGPIKITGTITDWSGNVNSNWRGLWFSVGLVPTHFFNMNGTTVNGYTHLGDPAYGDIWHQKGMAALSLTFCQQKDKMVSKIEDYVNSDMTTVTQGGNVSANYDFELVYDFEAKTISASFNGSAFVTRDISEVLAECGDSFILQVFTINSAPSNSKKEYE